MSIILCNFEACGDSGSAWIKFTMCIPRLEMQWFMRWLKWWPTTQILTTDVIEVTLEMVRQSSFDLFNGLE